MKQVPMMTLVLLLPVLASGESVVHKDLSAVLALQPDSARGEQLFARCASCHGADGAGVMYEATPRIAGQHYRVLVRQIVDFRHGKRWDMRMEGVVGSHNALPERQDIADVAAYVSSMERDGTRVVGDGDNLERGAQLYAKNCASCHGDNAAGDEKRDIPRLGGQHAAYLARQIHDAVDGRRPALGRTHGRRFAPLDFAEVNGLADYLSRIGWKVSAATESVPAPPGQ
jgi:cytochrome c553